MNNYDSTADTLKHIKRVNELLLIASMELQQRAIVHDDSKLVSPEKELFDEYTPKLADVEYGSEEYKQFLSGLKVALDHHYAANSHHPEHYKNGVDGMNLFDLIEMLLDWKAASERHATGNIMKSLEINQERFKISPQLNNIIENTVRYLGWATPTAAAQEEEKEYPCGICDAYPGEKHAQACPNKEEEL